LKMGKCDTATLDSAVSELSGDISTVDGRVTALQSIVDYNLRLENASEINYNNTSSKLTSTSVQGAIDEVNQKVGSIVVPGANGIAYDRTTSKLASTNVQGAIDEVYAALINAGTMKYDDATDTIYVLIDSTWTEWKKAGFSEVPLYKSGVNHANFVSYKGNSQGQNYSNDDAGYSDLTITYGTNIEANFVGTNGTRVTSIMSGPVTISGRDNLVFDYSVQTSVASASIRHISVFVTSVLQEKMNAVCERVLLGTSGTSGSGTAEIDVSNLNGTYYVGINLITQNPLSLSIGNMVLR